MVSTLIRRDLVRASRVAEHCRVGVVAPRSVARNSSSRDERRSFDSRERYPREKDREADNEEANEKKDDDHATSDVDGKKR